MSDQTTVATVAGVPTTISMRMPGVVDRVPAAERTGMFSDDPPVLADHDAIRIGKDFDGPADSTGSHRVFVVVEAHQAGLGDRRRHRVEAVKPARIRDEL